MKVIVELRKPHRCPQCGFVRVKRESVGIWKCSKCSYTFAGGAYTPTTKLGIVARRAAKGLTAEEATKAATEASVEPATEEETQ